MTDGTAYNHYSPLRSYEAAFGLPALANAGDAVVPQMSPVFHPSPSLAPSGRRRLAWSPPRGCASRLAVTGVLVHLALIRVCDGCKFRLALGGWWTERCPATLESAGAIARNNGPPAKTREISSRSIPQESPRNGVKVTWCAPRDLNPEPAD